jgi:hypothetical protein
MDGRDVVGRRQSYSGQTHAWVMIELADAKDREDDDDTVQ